jgi:glycosyltransferase involved in cell wall biosynthesis
MRITLVSDTFVPEVNGVATVLATMQRGLRARGHAVQVLAPAYDGVCDHEPDIHRIPSRPCPGYPAVQLSWPWGRGIPRMIDRFDPDLIHVATEGPLGSLGRQHALRSHRPLVTSFHTDFPRYAARYLGPWAVAPTRRYLAWFHGPALLTQTPSDVTCAELRRFGLAHPTVWGRAVDTHAFVPWLRDERRRRELAPNGELVVLHVGRLAVEKDMATLVAAFEKAHAAIGRAASFCVAGDGPEAERVRRALPFARHFGFLERTRLAELYADADLFVFPSPTETCGLVALEAMASALPVIAADSGGVRDNVRDGLTGRLLPTGDAVAFAHAIVELAADATTRKAMAEAARAFAVGRDWSRELDLLLEQYDDVRRRHSEAHDPRELEFLGLSPG